MGPHPCWWHPSAQRGRMWVPVPAGRWRCPSAPMGLTPGVQIRWTLHLWAMNGLSTPSRPQTSAFPSCPRRLWDEGRLPGSCPPATWVTSSRGLVPATLTGQHTEHGYRRLRPPGSWQLCCENSSVGVSGAETLQILWPVGYTARTSLAMFSLVTHQ